MEVKLKNREHSQEFLFQIPEQDSHKRLDVFLTERLSFLSRSQIQRYIQEETENCVLVNSSGKKPNYRLQKGDTVEVHLPEPKDTSLRPADILLDIIYEDRDIIVLNKKPGIPVHPSYGHSDDTIVNALLNYLGKNGMLSSIGGEKRPGIVHRLDKDTSGVLIVAKNNQAHSHLTYQFADRTPEKVYEAIVKGTLLPPEGIIDKPIARSMKNRKKFTTAETGREAITHYHVIDSKNQTSWVKFIPKTGRTHQIRVHAQSIGYPIVGDPLYARKSYQAEYIALVAKEITFTHPRTGRRVTFLAPYPKHFIALAESLGYAVKRHENIE